MRIINYLICSLFLISSQASLFSLDSPYQTEHISHKYDPLYMFSINHISTDDNKSFTLSDGSVWKSLENAIVTWNVGDRVIICWDPTVRNYFLKNVSNDLLLEKMEGIIEFVTMIEAPQLKVDSIQDNFLTLSDGNTFEWTPVVGNIEVGDHLQISYNDHDDRSSFPYFFIAYQFVEDPSTQEGIWKTSGEVKAFLTSSP